MLRVSPKLFSSSLARMAFLFAGALIIMALAPIALRAQRPKDALDADADNRPAFSDFKGVSIGTHADKARKKLGSPRDKSAEHLISTYSIRAMCELIYTSLPFSRATAYYGSQRTV